MADFEPLFELKNQYRESCPVLLQSGALYREEPTASAEAEETETAEATLPAEQEEAASPRTFLRLAFRNIDPRAVTSHKRARRRARPPLSRAYFGPRCGLRRRRGDRR